MNNFRNILALLICAIAVTACVTGNSSSSKASVSYSEDLTTFRPQASDSIVNQESSSTMFRRTSENYTASTDVTSLLNAKLDTLAESNKQIRSVSGLTIQIYSGSSSDLAYQARDSAMTVLPEIRTIVQYDQPVYKVRVGKFTEKLEAQRTLMRLKPKFPAAIAVPTTIYIN